MSSSDVSLDSYSTKQQQLSRRDIIQKIYEELGGNGKNEGVRIDDSTIIFDSRKYYNQAHDLLVIPILKQEGKSIPEFIILLSDLSEELNLAINRLDSYSLTYVFKTAVGQIFEDIIKYVNKNPDPEAKRNSKSGFQVIDPDYYKNDVYKTLKVRLVRK